MASVSRQVRRRPVPQLPIALAWIVAFLVEVTPADNVQPISSKGTPVRPVKEQTENGPERKRKLSNGSPKKLPPKVDYDDTDELGLELVQGFASMVGGMFGLAGDSVRTVSQTTAGAAGGSVKLVGGAVKGFGKAVETMGERTTGYGVPGGSVVGGMLGVMGHAARGLGDTVSVLGHVAEEITAETGKVFEDAVRSSNPLDAVSTFLDTSNAPPVLPNKSTQKPLSTSTGTGSSSGSGTRWGRWDDRGRPQSRQPKITPGDKATSGATPSPSGAAFDAVNEDEHQEPENWVSKSIGVLMLLLHGSVALMAACTQRLLGAAAGLAAPTCGVPSLLPHLCAAGLFVRGVSALLDRNVDARNKSTKNSNSSSSNSNGTNSSGKHSSSSATSSSRDTEDRSNCSGSTHVGDVQNDTDSSDASRRSQEEGTVGDDNHPSQPLPHRSWWRRRGAIAGAVVYVAAVDQTARVRVASRAAVEAVGTPPDGDWGGGYHTGLEGGGGKGGWSLGGQPESVEWLNSIFAAIWHQPLTSQTPSNIDDDESDIVVEEPGAVDHSSSTSDSSSRSGKSRSSSDRRRQRRRKAKHAPPPVVCHGCNGTMCTTAGGVGPYVAASVIHDVTEVLAESSAKPDSIASVAIQGFDLGKDPPRLRSVDVVDYGGSYSSSSRGGAVRLRLKAGWAAEGFKFALSLKLSTLEHAMLPQLTLRVDRLVVGLVADVELVPRTTMPFLEAVRVSLAEVPTIDFRLQPLSGVDLVAVPGLRAWIQTAIQSALVDAVSPGYLEISVAELYGDPCADIISSGNNNCSNNANNASASACSSVKVTPKPLEALLEGPTSTASSMQESKQPFQGMNQPSSDAPSSDPATMAATAAAAAAATTTAAHTPEAFKARMAQALAASPATSDGGGANGDLSTGKHSATPGDKHVARDSEAAAPSTSTSNSHSAGTQLASELWAWLQLAQKRHQDQKAPLDSSFQTNALIAAAAAASAAAKAHPDNFAVEKLSSPAEREDALNHSEDSDDKKESRREGEDDNGNRDDPGGVPAAPLSSSKVWKRDPGAILLSALTAGAKEWWEHQKELLKEASNESKEAREQETNRGS